MKCTHCKNKPYCGQIRRYNMKGCTSGIPAFAPEKVAMELALTIRTAQREFELDEIEYYAQIIQQTQEYLQLSPADFYKKHQSLI